MEYYIHSIGRVDDIKTYQKIESIIKLNMIASRKVLFDLGYGEVQKTDFGRKIPKGKEYMYYKDDIHYNKISLHDSSHHLIKKLILKDETIVGCFDSSRVAFLISNQVQTLSLRQTKGIDIGEEQVEGTLDFSYVLGVIIPSLKYLPLEKRDIIMDLISEIYKRNNLPVTFYSYDGTVIRREALVAENKTDRRKV
ncbi:MAG: hypothetical protein R3Y21_02400 [Mycoplasmatota bacterium]